MEISPKRPNGTVPHLKKPSLESGLVEGTFELGFLGKGCRDLNHAATAQNSGRVPKRRPGTNPGTSQGLKDLGLLHNVRVHKVLYSNIVALPNEQLLSIF